MKAKTQNEAQGGKPKKKKTKSEKTGMNAVPYYAGAVDEIQAGS